MGGAKRHEMVVDGDTCVVHTAFQGKTCKAWGNFRGHHVSGSGRSEPEALSHWEDLANMHSDDEPKSPL